MATAAIIISILTILMSLSSVYWTWQLREAYRVRRELHNVPNPDPDVPTP